MGFSFVLPLRAGSQRIKNKNTKKFSNFEGGLTELKITQLLKVKQAQKIYITTDDEEAIEIAKSFHDERIVIDKRPTELCGSLTKIEDLIDYIGNLVESDHVFWVHATAPFTDEKVYKNAWGSYCNNILALQNHDSLMSVNKIQQFLWDKELRKVINNPSTETRWPQTQDLNSLFEINHAFYIISRDNLKSMGDRIGLNPLCFELDKIAAIDIDWPEDFGFAELLFDNLNK